MDCEDNNLFLIQPNYLLTFHVILFDDQNYRKPTSSSKLDTALYKKKGPDFTDYAYKEAVNRLKFLLAESYSPTKMSNFYHRHFDDSGDDTDNQSINSRPALAEISKYIPYNSNLTRYNSLKKLNYPPTFNKDYSLLKPIPSTSSIHRTTNLVPPPPPPQIQISEIGQQQPQELLNFIEKQEGYIEQLERESQFCRGELSSLLNKVKDVISENETLTDQAKVTLPRSILPSDITSESEDTEIEYRKPIKKLRTPLEGPNIVFESRISELEAQLTQSHIDVQRLQHENDTIKRNQSNGGGGGGGAGDHPGTGDAYRKQIDNLQRDKQAMDDTIRKLQADLHKMKDVDATNFSKTQRNRDIAEQALFERTQSDMETRRLKDELERQHERIRELQHEMARRVAEERANAERRYNYQVDQLGGDLSSQWETSSKLQLELERHKRMESDYKRDIAQKNAQIDEIKMEMKSKTANLLSDIAQVNAEKQSLEQEITSMR